MEQKVEYYCECGRHFIIVSAEMKPKKCPKCARVMYPKTDESNEAAFPKSKRSKNPLENLEDTVEYEYTFDKQGQRVRKGSEPFTFGKLIRKIWMLFSVGGSSYRNY